MTLDEAINQLKDFIILHREQHGWDVRTLKALDMAIKALEQQDALNKIRDEIADMDDANYDYEGYYKAVTDALKVIDKYKAESEEDIEEL